MLPASFQGLVNALQDIPSIGGKTAQRLAFQLLVNRPDTATKLLNNLNEAINKTQLCEQCRNISDAPICHICSAANREQNTICIVCNPLDLLAVENTKVYKGLYFVLHGVLSPIKNKTPKDLGIAKLQALLKSKKIDELIIAINKTAEGLATTHYIESLQEATTVKISYIAHGVPFGGELEYVDHFTLEHAILGRK